MRFTAFAMSLIMAATVFGTSCKSNKREIIPLEDVKLTDENTYSCTFDGNEREFTVYLPEETKGAPLVLMLHGFNESPKIMRRNTKFDEDAVPEGYAVCYAKALTASPTFSEGWNSGIGSSDTKDLEFLVSLADYLEKEYKLDTNRTFAVGFSNGAFMTYRLAMEASDVFEAVVSVAGMCPEMVWNERVDKISVGFFQVTGEKDDVVPKHSDGTADHSVAPAVEDVIDYWATANGLELMSEENIGKDSLITKYGGARSGREVWHLFVTGGRHSWSNENLTGINTNQLIIEFLDTQ